MNREQATVQRPTAALVVATNWRDVQIVFIGALLLVLLFGLHVNDGPLFIVRSILGLIYVLFVPGYCLVQAIFPAPDDLDGLGRVGASIGLSVVAIPLLALVLDQTDAGLQPGSILAIDLGFIGFCCAISVVLRTLRASGPLPAGHGPVAGWRTLSGRLRIALIAFSVLFLAATSVGVALVHKAMTTYATEFYILGPGGQAQQYPLTVAAGSTMSITAGIVSEEAGVHRYHVEVWAEDQAVPGRTQRVARSASVLLKKGQQTQFSLTWRLPWGSQNEKVDFRLFAGDGAQPYRELWLYLNP